MSAESIYRDPAVQDLLVAVRATSEKLDEELARLQAVANRAVNVSLGLARSGRDSTSHMRAVKDPRVEPEFADGLTGKFAQLRK